MFTMAPVTQSNPLGQYLNEMTTITAQAAELNQSPRWHADSNGVWYLKNEAGTGNVVNSWFQDLDGSWYLLAPNDGHMYAGLIHDTLTDKWYYCQTEHDGYYGRMAHTDGVYTVNNQQVHLTFNQNHDGTFGAITSGLSSLQSTGVASQDVAGLPTESTGAILVDLGRVLIIQHFQMKVILNSFRVDLLITIRMTYLRQKCWNK